jgi:hypothetical protein
MNVQPRGARCTATDDVYGALKVEDARLGAGTRPRMTVASCESALL